MSGNTLDDLFVMIAFPDTPEERDDAERQIKAMLDDAKDRVGKRYATLHQMLRDELQAQAWDRGMGDQLKLLKAGPGYEMGNPYRKPRP
jgi:hypothetical protein